MKIIELTEDKIEFSDGTVITAEHDQDCCEHVYAAFRELEPGALYREFKRISIRGVKDAGFRLNGYFIPCYNSQNGYYSSSLELIINYPDGRKVVKDISEFVKDDID